MIQEDNWVITTKNGKGKLPLFCGDGERIITIYGYRHVRNIPDTRLFMRSKQSNEWKNALTGE